MIQQVELNRIPFWYKRSISLILKNYNVWGPLFILWHVVLYVVGPVSLVVALFITPFFLFIADGCNRDNRTTIFDIKINKPMIKSILHYVFWNVVLWFFAFILLVEILNQQLVTSPASEDVLPMYTLCWLFARTNGMCVLQRGLADVPIKTSYKYMNQVIRMNYKTLLVGLLLPTLALMLISLYFHYIIPTISMFAAVLLYVIYTEIYLDESENKLMKKSSNTAVEPIHTTV